MVVAYYSGMNPFMIESKRYSNSNNMVRSGGCSKGYETEQWSLSSLPPPQHEAEYGFERSYGFCYRGLLISRRVEIGTFSLKHYRRP